MTGQLNRRTFIGASAAMAASPTSDALAIAARRTGGAAAPVVSLLLRNTDGAGSPQHTCIAFGHPFRKGDVPPGWGLSAVLTNGAAVPSQIDQISLWSDGSIRFAVIKLRTGSIAAGGSLPVWLMRSGGNRLGSPPAGANALSIARNFAQTFRFRMEVANLTRFCRTPRRDGSGRFFWQSSDPLALQGWADAGAGGYRRPRVEVIESGPLCCTLRLWGPIRDSAGGSYHDQLIVIGYYRIWLDDRGGIDRVEHVHAIHQGWIASFTGKMLSGAGLQIGDWSLTLNGEPVAGSSLGSGLRFSHHSRHFCASPTGKSLWTTKSSSIYPKFDTMYWFRTKVPPPFDIPYFREHPLDPSTETLPVRYAAGNRFTAIFKGRRVGYCGKQYVGFNDGGEHEHLELVPNWSHRAYITQDPGFIDSDDVTALYWGHQPSKILNEETGKIPSAVTETFPGLGSGHGNLLFYSPRAHSADFPELEQWSPAANKPIAGYATDPDDTEGGWSFTDWNSHMPSDCYIAYLRTGAPWLLDLMILDASTTIINKTPGSMNPVGRDRHEFGRVWRGLWCVGMVPGWNERNEAWSWKMIYQCLAVLPNSANYPEHAYLKSTYDTNCDYASATINNASPAQTATGAWVFTKPLFMSPWMSLYIFLARCHEYLVLEDYRALKFLNFSKNYIRGLGGDAPVGYTCGWMMGSYETIFGVPNSSPPRYFASWDEVPDYVDARLAAFDPATGYVSLSGGIGYLRKFPYRDHDRVMFSRARRNLIVEAAPPPPGIESEKMYWVVQADPPGDRFRVSASRGGPPIAIGTAAKGVGIFHKRTSTTCPATGTCDDTNDDEVAEGRLGLFYGCVAIGQAAGVQQLARVWQASAARVAAAGQYWTSGRSQLQFGDWRQSAKHKMASHIP